jgi:hypothetical protein
MIKLLFIPLVGIFCLSFNSNKTVKNVKDPTVDIIFITQDEIQLVNLNGIDAVYNPSVKYNQDTAIINFKRSLFFHKVNDKLILKKHVKYIKCEETIFKIIDIEKYPFKKCQKLF